MSGPPGRGSWCKKDISESVIVAAQLGLQAAGDRRQETTQSQAAVKSLHNDWWSEEWRLLRLGIITFLLTHSSQAGLKRDIWAEAVIVEDGIMRRLEISCIPGPE